MQLIRFQIKHKLTRNADLLNKVLERIIRKHDPGLPAFWVNVLSSLAVYVHVTTWALLLCLRCGFPATTKMEKAVLLQGLFVCLFVSSFLFHLCLSRLPSSLAPPSPEGEREKERDESREGWWKTLWRRDENWNGLLLKCEGERMKQVNLPVKPRDRKDRE